MLRKLKERILRGRNERKIATESLSRLLHQLESGQDGLWARMVELEIERGLHTGKDQCPGCAYEVQKHMDDLDIDSIITPESLKELVREILREELGNGQHSIKLQD